jgi:hypothetical protein
LKVYFDVTIIGKIPIFPAKWIICFNLLFTSLQPVDEDPYTDQYMKVNDVVKDTSKLMPKIINVAVDDRE